MNCIDCFFLGMLTGVVIFSMALSVISFIRGDDDA